MKIAVFDHIGNWGGGSRYARALILALKKQYPETQITFFGNRASLIRENMNDEFLTAGIGVEYFQSLINREHNFLYKIASAIFKKICSKLKAFNFLFQQYDLQKEIVSFAKGYDIAFFPWPYFIECPSLDCPVVGVFHDFNFRYFFGAPIFSEKKTQELNRQITEWLLRVTPVVSSHFTASELEKFYPNSVNKVQIVHLAPFDISNNSVFQTAKIIEELGIKTPFVLYPTNMCCHKNIGILLRAFYLLRRNGVQLSLVITGPGTECITGTASEHGVEKRTSNPDVWGLGYVSNLQMDALIQNAKVVISTSLYEAGNGPGLEAWGRGVPVLMSDIPSFVEHMEVLEVKATLIDPHDANDVAEKIHNVLSNYDQALMDAELSRKNLSRHTWDKVARQYYEIFSTLAQVRMT